MRPQTARRRAHAAEPSLARDGGRTIVGAVVSNACNFAVLLLVARALGSEAVGLYSIVFAARAILVLVCGLGMRVALTHFVARGVATQDWALARGAARAGTSVPLAVAVLVGFISYISAETLALEVFGKPQLELLIQLVSLSLPFSVAMDVALSGTQGFQTMQPHARIALIFEPSFRLLLTVIGLALGLGLTGAVGAILVASVVASTAALTTLAAMTRALPKSKVLVPWRDMSNFAGVSWVASMATQGLLWADVVILGAMVAADEVGVYQVAARVVMVAMIVITPLTSSMAPRIAHAWARNDLRSLEASYQGVVLWSWRLTLPILTGAIVVPAAALHAFGADFSGGVPVVYVLVAGALVESIAAPSAVLLNQIGRNRINMAINLSALTANIGLNIALIPVWGILGSAIAWTLALIVPGLIRIVVVARVLGTRWPFSREHGTALLAAALVGLTAVVLVYRTDAAPSWQMQLAVAGVLIALGYSSLLVLAGLRRSEQAWVKAVASLQLRALSTRMPALRKFVNRRRLRGLRSGGEPLEIRRLVSPYRYDILARAEFFRLATENRDLSRDRPGAFAEIVKQSRYRQWFDAIVLPQLGLESAPPRHRDMAFAQNIKRNLHLLRSFEENGFDERHPISLVRIPAGTRVADRALAEDWWAPYDGGHRLSLLILSGETHLAPHQYVVKRGGVARFNTVAVARVEKLHRAGLLRFFAWGLIDDPQQRNVGTWEELLDRVSNPRNAAYLALWPEATTLSESAPPDWFDIEEPIQARHVVS